VNQSIVMQKRSAALRSVRTIEDEFDQFLSANPS